MTDEGGRVALLPSRIIFLVSIHVSDWDERRHENSETSGEGALMQVLESETGPRRVCVRIHVSDSMEAGGESSGEMVPGRVLVSKKGPRQVLERTHVSGRAECVPA